MLLQFRDKGGQLGVLGEISDALVTKSSVVDAEVEIIKSRRILGAAIELLKLDILIKPKAFPVVGEFLAQRRMKSQSKAARSPFVSGGGELAWADSDINIESLELGSSYVSKKHFSKKLTLKSMGNGKYELLGPDESLLIKGLAGEQQVADKGWSGGYPSPYRIDILISTLDVEPGAEFYITRQSLQRSHGELSKMLTTREEGKGSGLLRMIIEGKDPRRIARILTAIVELYLAFNVDKQSGEIQHMLEFVQKETLSTKQRLEQAETALVQYLLSLKSAGLSAEITSLINRLSSITSQITELEIQKVGFQSKYTENHPAILNIVRKIRLLDSEKADIEMSLKLLPEEERKRAAFLRDVDAAKQHLLILKSKEQELGVALSSITSSIKVIDHAQVSTAPIRPKRLMVLAKGLILGLFLGFLYVLGRRALQISVENK